MARPITRRDLLRLGLLGGAGLAFAPPILGAAPATPAGPMILDRSKAKAKAVIQIWLWGGPSHIDTFDPKPNAGREYAGPFTKALPTNVDGIQVGPLLPRLATMADKYCLLRGMTHNNNGHETAAYLVQAGRKPVEGVVFPGIGAIVAYAALQAGYKGLLPPYITVTRPQGRFSESGFLGAAYKPFATGGDPAKDPFAVEGVVSATINEERQRQRQALLNELDGLGRGRTGDPLVDAFNANQEQAYAMILGSEGKAFALQEESGTIRDGYGRNTFGQSCLLARRLVQRGVPYVTINYQGWDTHKNHFEAMNRKLPELDTGLAALLADLAANGLLDSTIVWWGGEFGRTPKIATESPWNGGRHHYGKAFSYLVAGGGFTGGKTVGATDDKGETVVQRPIYPWDLMGTMYGLLGMRPDVKLPHPQGRSVTVAPAPGEIPAKETGGLLKEIV